MEDSKLLLVFLLLLPISLLHPRTTTAQLPPEFLFHRCSGDNYTINSTYRTNLNNLLSSLSSATPNTYGFYNLTAGLQGPDKAYGIALCRGSDLGPEDCHPCLQDAARRITVDCPTQSEAMGWYDACMIRYSNRDIFGVQDTRPSFCLSNRDLDTDVNTFNRTVFALLGKLRNMTASGDDQLKFAVDEDNFTDSFNNEQRLFALTQCTPDLSKPDCYDCLGAAMDGIPSCCGGKIGCRVILPSCSITYEQYIFWDSNTLPSPPSLASPAPSPKSIDSNDTGTIRTRNLITAIIVPVVLSVVLGTIIHHLRKRRITFKKQKAEIGSADCLQFELRTIRAATNDFSVANELGRGGFAMVYKGTLSNGQEIAVKRPFNFSAHGAEEFRNEVQIVAQLHHRNLVRLLGFCSDGKERILIYEFLPNKSLDDFLFDPIKSALLNWERRYKIILGIARGLLYLHQDSHIRIVHRDLKAGNVLLDVEMNPKISDFGTARMFQLNQAQLDTTKPVGTYGYMPPEYVLYGQFSVKLDIFSFGVLVLEIISGQKITRFRIGGDEDGLLGFAWVNWLQGTPLNLVDGKLLSHADTDMILRCINVALLCVQENDVLRPNMSSVVPMLSSHSITLPHPSRPPFVFSMDDTKARTLSHYCSINESNQSNDMSGTRSANEVSVSTLGPR
ncbi:hypothetical protein Dimus_032211 [Dionaea muscipula]